ncbi:MAG: hypothetical protein HY922_14980 [Elusimicrobia bacterium]|nr:hypothetical protein [Elusimicrobiota bacterium]
MRSSAIPRNCRYRENRAAIVGGKLAVKIGPGGWSPGAGWGLAAYGKDYALIRRSRSFKRS